MEDSEIEELENKVLAKKQEVALSQQNAIADVNPIGEQINTHLQNIFQETIVENSQQVKELADTAVKTEIAIKNDEVAGRKKVKEAQIEKTVTEARTEEDEAKHKRAQTILKSQGLTSQLPSLYRQTALVIGYPLFFVYLITFGWIIQMFTFLIKGFITMVAECAERFAEVNKKFIDNDNSKQFDLRKSMFNILKWVLIVGAVITIVVLWVLK